MENLNGLWTNFKSLHVETQRLVKLTAYIIVRLIIYRLIENFGNTLDKYY